MDRFGTDGFTHADGGTQQVGPGPTSKAAPAPPAPPAAVESLGMSGALDIQPVIQPVILRGGQPGAIVLLDDWNALFAAVRTRLRTIATAPAGWPQGVFDEQQPHPMAAQVFDCALALDSLHGQLMNELVVFTPDARQVRRGAPMQSLPARIATVACDPGEAHGANSAGGIRVTSSGTSRVLVRQQIRRIDAAMQPLVASGALPWPIGEAVLRECIAREQSRALARAGSFALLRIGFRNLDGVCAAPESVAALDPAAGHEVANVNARGQHLVAAIVARLRGVLRRQDVIAQISPSHFCCLLVDELSPAALSARTFSVVNALSLPFSLNGELRRVEPAFGVARYPKDGATADELLQFAARSTSDLRSWGRRIAACGSDAR